MKRIQCDKRYFGAGVSSITLSILIGFLSLHVERSFILIPSTSSWYEMAQAITLMGSAYVIWSTALLLTAYNYSKYKSIKKEDVLLLTSLLLCEITVMAMKILCGIPRPYYQGEIPGDLLDRFTILKYLSYPSGHTSRFTAFSYWVSKRGRVGRATWIFLVLIAVSRVVLHVHYVCDVIGAFFIGMGISLIVNSTSSSTSDIENHGRSPLAPASFTP
ncbi:MAG: phosphatase PAP2 family protein [Thermoprotei archaeon]|nr:phosphatase PAP2 family protein [Thermoprotei archaeon]